MAFEVKTAEGRRVICDGDYGTVKFFGEVPPASGLWYGIEWDEDGRGKHSGEHEGVKYFQCSRPGAGSFVRERKLDFGVSVVEAVRKKFDDLHRAEGKELQFVYQVGRNEDDNVEEKLKRLQHVSLGGINVSGSSKQQSLCDIAPNIVELDLSKTLLSDWQEVLEIIKDLCWLRRLNLSKIQLRHESLYSKLDSSAKSPVETLVVNKMNLDWEKILTISSSFGNLKELHASFNNIQSLKGGDVDAIKKLHTLNLEGNSLSNWNEVLLLECLTVLQTLVLNKNQLSKISFPGNVNEVPDIFSQLKSLSLSQTMIESWSSVNQLNRLASLEVLAIKECPLVDGITDYEAREELIARIAKCVKLNQSNVTHKERQAAERAYLKKYGKEWLGSGGNPDSSQSNVHPDFVESHPRFVSLIDCHGIPEGLLISLTKGSTLRDNLVTVTITYVNDLGKQSVTKKLPCTMTISKLKGLLQRLFKVVPVNQSLSHIDQTGHKVMLDDDLRPLSFYSVKSGDIIHMRC